MNPQTTLAWARRRVRWLLCLLLLLPLAQLAGAVHALSHLNTAGDPQREEPALVHAQCALCVAAASLASGALPAAPLAIPPKASPLPWCAPLAAAPAPDPAAPQHRNRGPPLLLS